MAVETGYEQTEVGVIPRDWVTKPLIELCAPNGLVRGPFGGSLKKEFFVESGIKVYEQKNAIDKSVEIGSYFIDNSKFGELKRFEVAEGDFIVSCSGTIGRIFQIPPGAPKGIINQALLKIKTDEKVVDDKYFLFYFEWGNFQERIIDNTQGGAMKNLVGMSIFENTSIALPPTKAEQTAIATALSDVDALISNLEKLISKKRNLKQGTMQLLLTGKKRLPGFTGDWGVMTLQDMTKNISDIVDGPFGSNLKTSDYVDRGVPVLQGLNITHDKFIWKDVRYISLNKAKELYRSNARIGDILTVKIGSVGFSAVIDNLNGNEFSIIPANLMRTRLDEHMANSKFIYYLLTSFEGKNKLLDLAGNTAQPALSLNSFRNISFRVPKTISEQTAIAQVVSDMDAEIEGLEQKLAKYKMIKQGMMQELLTGRTRLM